MDTETFEDLDGTVEKIAKLGVDATKLDTIDVTPNATSKGLVPFAFGFNHQTGELKDLRPLAEAWRIFPERKKGTATVSTLDSFIDLINRHKTEHSVVFASTCWPKLFLLAVIDYHEANEGNAAFGQHRINYTFPVTDEFNAWMAMDGKAMSQLDFATFIENRIAEVASPSEDDKQYSDLFQTKFASAADMMMLSRGLEVHVASAVKAQHTLASGEKEIVFTEQHDTKITVPGLFMVSVPAFLDSDPVRLPARLRYRVASGSISWFYQMYRWKELLRKAIVQDVLTVHETTNLPTFEGMPESGG